MELSIFLQNSITLILENMMTTLITIFIILFTIKFIIKTIKDKKSYNYVHNLIKEDMGKGLKRLKKIKDIEIKKKLLLEGEQSLGKSLYQKVKKELINDGIVDDFFNKLIKGKEESRIEACKVLIQIETPQAIDYAILALYDKSPKIKKIAIESLTEKVNPKIIETFIAYLPYCDSEMTLSILTKAFEKIGDLAFEQLVDLAFTKKEVYRSWAIKLLSNMNHTSRNNEDIIKIFIHLLKDKSDKIRVQAIKALSKFKDKEVVFGSLINRLKDSSYSVRMEAAKSLGEYGWEAAASYLFSLITDSNQRVKESAYQALTQLGDEGFKYLIKATNIKRTREEALQVLKELEMEKVIDNINKIYNLNQQASNKLVEELSLNNNFEENDQENLKFKIIG